MSLSFDTFLPYTDLLKAAPKKPGLQKVERLPGVVTIPGDAGLAER